MMLGDVGSRRPLGRTTAHVAVVLSAAFALLAGAVGYWGVVQAPELVRTVLGIRGAVPSSARSWMQ